MFNPDKYKIRSMQRLKELAEDCIVPEHVVDWFSQPSDCFKGKTAFEMCLTDEGYDEVERILRSIQHGFPA